jgi:hypothetical protein
MNWKVLLGVGAGILVGVLGAPHLSRTVQAAGPAGNNGRYQLQGVTVDESPAGSNGSVPYHEVFFVDTEAGRVWQYQSLTTIKQNDGKTAFIPASFEQIGISKFAPVQP